MDISANNSMPSQKLSMSKKTDTWRESNINGALALIFNHNNSRRSSKYRKKINYDLYNGKINKSDLEYVTNPLGISNVEFPAQIQPYDVWSPIFNLLFGEEVKRPFNFIVKSINEDAISEKEEGRKQIILQKLQELLVSSQEEMPETPEELKKYMSYSEQDMREVTASHLLNYLRKDLRLEQVFAKGWEDALLAGEEIYAIESIASEPCVRRCNPLEIHCLLPHNSDLIDDAEIIVEETYMSLSKIVDTFYDSLTEKNVARLEELAQGGMAATTSFTPEILVLPNGEVPPDSNNQTIFDNRGNLRVCKVTWKSKRKVGKLKYIDEFNQEQETLVDETYKVDKNNPDESVDWIWINQYWEGWKIADDLYLNIHPKEQQFRRMDNYSICKSGYVGTIYNCNNSTSVSLMDRLTPWIYLYIIIAYRTELAIAKNLGKLARINISMIPDGWEVEKWLYYATAMGIAFEDPFNEGKKGAATGKLAGNMNHQSGSIDLETGNYIQSHIQLLAFIEDKLASVSGVTPQRMGAINTSELVGNVERSVQQSAIITEKWFEVHNYTKQRVLECLLEVAKDIYSGKTKKLQYITDDLASIIFNIDDESFACSEYGIFVTNAGKDYQTLQMLKEIMHASIQNDKLELSDAINILNTESIAEIKNKLVQSEQERNQREQLIQEQQINAQNQAIQAQMADKEEDRNWQSEEKALDRQNKIDVATISALGAASVGAKEEDINNNLIPDVLEIEKLAQKDKEHNDKLNLERDKLVHETVEKAKDRAHENQKLKKEEQLRKKELQLKDKEIAVKKIAARKKPSGK